VPYLYTCSSELVRKYPLDSRLCEAWEWEDSKIYPKSLDLDKLISMQVPVPVIRNLLVLASGVLSIESRAVGWVLRLKNNYWAYESLRLFFKNACYPFSGPFVRWSGSVAVLSTSVYLYRKSAWIRKRNAKLRCPWCGHRQGSSGAHRASGALTATQGAALSPYAPSTRPLRAPRRDKQPKMLRKTQPAGRRGRQTCSFGSGPIERLLASARVPRRRART